jgi:hypothetical protein
VLTFRFAGAAVAPRSAWCLGAVVALSVLTSIPARADKLFVGGCTAGRGSLNCVGRLTEPGDPYVREVPQPHSEADKARAGERDQKWLERCRPVIRQDRYGVGRYGYAAPGCEFGVFE